MQSWKIRIITPDTFLLTQGAEMHMNKNNNV